VGRPFVPIARTKSVPARRREHGQQQQGKRKVQRLFHDAGVYRHSWFCGEKNLSAFDPTKKKSRDLCGRG
jgi:hypothetical protein